MYYVTNREGNYIGFDTKKGEWAIVAGKDKATPFIDREKVNTFINVMQKVLYTRLYMRADKNSY